MNTLADWIQALWPVLAALLGFVIWLVRLEMKQKELFEKCKEFKKLYDSCSGRQERWNDEIRQQLGFITTSQARIEGILSIIHRNLNGGFKNVEDG